MKWLKPGRDNKEERMNFVEYWANYVRTHPDKVWSKQQKMLIDSMIKNARHYKLTPKQYLKIKGECNNRILYVLFLFKFTNSTSRAVS